LDPVGAVGRYNGVVGQEAAAEALSPLLMPGNSSNFKKYRNRYSECCYMIVQF
jgi:hypothetical protein